jgi:hypothetical protein
MWPQRCDGWDGMHCIAGPAARKDEDERMLCHHVCHLRTMTLEQAEAYTGEKWAAR